MEKIGIDLEFKHTKRLGTSGFTLKCKYMNKMTEYSTLMATQIKNQLVTGPNFTITNLQLGLLL